jgi:hypothetical protein
LDMLLLERRTTGSLLRGWIREGIICERILGDRDLSHGL